MQLFIRSQVGYSSASGPCTYVFNIEAAHLGSQTIESESMEVEPGGARDLHERDELGNRYTRCHLREGGDLVATYEAVVGVSHRSAQVSEVSELSPGELPLSILPYTYPSRYCQSDRLMRMAQSEFGHLDRGFGRVLAICDWITEKIEYFTGSTNSHTSAFDTATERVGVCRDFAHLGIAFCRALNIPARFVSVYAFDLQPQDFHAVFEAYLDGRWWLFDPTRLVPLDAVVRIGTGRDAADVSFATIWGAAQLTTQSVSVERMDGQGSAWDGSPVSMT
ncbi:transglutaminase family protein [soil metagenome]